METNIAIHGDQDITSSCIAIASHMGNVNANTTKVDLNKLKSRVLKARMMGLPDADKFEREYEAALQAVNAQ